MYFISVVIPDVPIVVARGLSWSKRIVTEKSLNWKENAKPIIAERSSSTGLEYFWIEPKDISYYQ
jgi:hypothetical protein